MKKIFAISIVSLSCFYSLAFAGDIGDKSIWQLIKTKDNVKYYIDKNIDETITTINFVEKGEYIAPVKGNYFPYNTEFKYYIAYRSIDCVCGEVINTRIEVYDKQKNFIQAENLNNSLSGGCLHFDGTKNKYGNLYEGNIKPDTIENYVFKKYCQERYYYKNQ